MLRCISHLHDPVLALESAQRARLSGPMARNGNGNGAMASRKWPFSSDEEYSWYLEDISRPYWRRQTKVQWVGQWPVGDPLANPEVGGERSLRSIQWMRGLRDDVKRKLPKYPSDWLDGFRAGGKSLAAISFLYFACLAPVVAFGGARHAK